jgi:hypothetical protein
MRIMNNPEVLACVLFSPYVSTFHLPLAPLAVPSDSWRVKKMPDNRLGRFIRKKQTITQMWKNY